MLVNGKLKNEVKNKTMINVIEMLIHAEDQTIKVCVHDGESGTMTVKDSLKGNQQTFQMPNKVIAAVLYLLVNSDSDEVIVQAAMYDIVGKTFDLTAPELSPIP